MSRRKGTWKAWVRCHACQRALLSPNRRRPRAGAERDRLATAAAERDWSRFVADVFELHSMDARGREEAGKREVVFLNGSPWWRLECGCRRVYLVERDDLRQRFRLAADRREDLYLLRSDEAERVAKRPR